MSKMIVEVDGVKTEYAGCDAFRDAVRDTVRAVKSSDGISPHNVRLIDPVDDNAEVILSEFRKGQRVGMPKT